VLAVTPVRRAPRARPAAVVETAAVEPVPVAPSMIPEPATTLDEIEQLARDLCAAGDAARKIVMLGTAPGEIITLTALTLARLMVREARVAVVDLAGFGPIISAVSVDQSAPGLAEVIKGEASFSEIITKDRLSRVHLVTAGRPGFDRSLLQSPRLALALDALLRVYDHVLIDAGAASDLPAELLTTNARAVVVPDPSLDAAVRTQMCEKLRAVGFSEVMMLSKSARSVEAVEPAQREVAA
jgi:Mrp family chromosome partitioning ATPase